MRRFIFGAVAGDGVKLGAFLSHSFFSLSIFFTSVKSLIACIEEEDDEMNMVDFFHDDMLI